MRGLAKYEARIAQDSRAALAMARIDRAICKRDARKRRTARRTSPVVTRLRALVFSNASDDEGGDDGGGASEAQFRRTARHLIEEGLLVGRAPGQGWLLAAPRQQSTFHAPSDVDALAVPLLLSNAPLALFDGTGRVVSIRLWRDGAVRVYVLCGSDHAADAQPATLGLSKRGYEVAQHRAAWLLGAQMSV
jgi:hypothetical protein